MRIEFNPQRIPMFRDLNLTELERVESICIQHAYRKKTVIFSEGEAKEAVYFIHNGMVKTYKTDENGHEQIVSFLKSGDLFPHTGFFHKSVYPATAETITDSLLLAIPIRSFEQLLLSTPSIAVKVMAVMSEKIAELQKKIQELSGQDVQNRAVSFLLHMAEKYGVLSGNAISIDLPITHQEIANSIGTSRETVNRLLNQLRKEQILEIKKNKLIILDIERLKHRLT